MTKFLLLRTPLWLFVVRWISVLVVLVVVGGPTMFVDAVRDMAASMNSLVNDVKLQHQRDLGKDGARDNGALQK